VAKKCPRLWVCNSTKNLRNDFARYTLHPRLHFTALAGWHEKRDYVVFNNIRNPYLRLTLYDKRVAELSEEASEEREELKLAIL